MQHTSDTKAGMQTGSGVNGPLTRGLQNRKVDEKSPDDFLFEGENLPGGDETGKQCLGDHPYVTIDNPDDF